jgi:hypothetical protein
MEHLTREQLSDWNENGFLLLSNFLSEEEKRAIVRWTSDLAEWPETPGKWMKYFEASKESGKKQLCRVENFVPYHKQFADFLTDPKKLEMLSQLMGESAILYKEKINFKLPGGKGFTHHQDAPAFTTFNQKYHITMMVALDPSTIQNGCLEVARAYHKRGILLQAPDGTLSKEVIASLHWEPIVMEPGDVLLFDSYVPHGSAGNYSDQPRRALYVTYNRASEGDYRDAYFKHKRESFPPECERVPGVDYSKGAGTYNLGNPID